MNCQVSSRLPRCGLDATEKKEQTGGLLGHRAGLLGISTLDLNPSELITIFHSIYWVVKLSASACLSSSGFLRSSSQAKFNLNNTSIIFWNLMELESFEL